MTEIEIKKGLAGVVVDYTAVSKVNPETNSLLYRGYPVQELAATQPFEAVAYLLWHGELPTDEQLARAASPRSGRTARSTRTCGQRSTSCRSTRTRWTWCAPRSADRRVRPRPRSTTRASPNLAQVRALPVREAARRSSRTTSAAAAGRSSSTRATTSTTRRTSCG